jgi:RNA polymerase sigma factor (TIGR02999 family)
LSRERPGQTLQPTALVHEAYLRLCGDREQSWESRAHFFGAAARAIRRILLDRARARRRLRRGGDARRVSLDCGPLGLDVADSSDDTARLDLVALDDALERLALIDPDSARVVELRFFGGLSSRETALSLGISESTEARAWRFARIWLHRELCGDASP